MELAWVGSATNGATPFSLNINTFLYLFFFSLVCLTSHPLPCPIIVIRCNNVVKSNLVSDKENKKKNPLLTCSVVSFRTFITTVLQIKGMCYVANWITYRKYNWNKVPINVFFFIYCHIIWSRHGQSQGLLYKHLSLIHSLINSFIKWSFSLPQLFGAATPKRLEIGLSVIK